MTLRRAASETADTSAAPFLAQGIEHLEQGLAELRELARGIHPSQLSEHGLAHAVGLLAERSPLTVEVGVLDERLLQSVETALYFTVAEGLTNVAKYADATRARVTVAAQDGYAHATIADDGRGGATATGGSGLRGPADRLEALGARSRWSADPWGHSPARTRAGRGALRPARTADPPATSRRMEAHHTALSFRRCTLDELRQV